MKVEFKRLREEARLPVFQTAGAARMDLAAALERPVVIAPGKTTLIPTGFAMKLPAGYEAQIRTRSGLALKFGLVVLNAPGTIDSDYRGEVGVILHNTSDHPQTVLPGERVAQMVIAAYAQPDLFEVEELDETARGTDGFGSTGRAA